MPWYSGIGSFGSCIERGGVESVHLAFFFVGSFGRDFLDFLVHTGVVGPLPTRPNSMACKWGWLYNYLHPQPVMFWNSVDGQLRLVVSPIIYRVLAIHLRWLFGISAINSMKAKWKPIPCLIHILWFVCWPGSCLIASLPSLWKKTLLFMLCFCTPAKKHAVLTLCVSTFWNCSRIVETWVAIFPRKQKNLPNPSSFSSSPQNIAEKNAHINLFFCRKKKSWPSQPSVEVPLTDLIPPFQKMPWMVLNLSSMAGLDVWHPVTWRWLVILRRWLAHNHP